MRQSNLKINIFSKTKSKLFLRTSILGLDGSDRLTTNSQSLRLTRLNALNTVSTSPGIHSTRSWGPFSDNVIFRLACCFNWSSNTSSAPNKYLISSPVRSSFRFNPPGGGSLGSPRCEPKIIIWDKNW